MKINFEVNLDQLKKKCQQAFNSLSAEQSAFFIVVSVVILFALFVSLGLFTNGLFLLIIPFGIFAYWLYLLVKMIKKVLGK